MSQESTVVFVDDELHIRTAAKQTLELSGYSVRCFDSAAPLLSLLSREWSAVVVTDVRMPGTDGLELMRKVLSVDRDLPVVLVTGHGDVAMAVKAMRDGAYDFLEKPFAAETLVEVVRRAVEKRQLTLENRALREEVETQNAPGPRLVGRTPPMQRLRAMIAQLADVQADVLIEGETGTGKDLVALLLHERSARRDNNFVAINCGAVPESLIESELFGHEPGAFTGAQGRRIGKFEHAAGGTLFLDEIESMALPLQVRLLRVLQERTVERLGSNESIPVDLRVVAATKRDLREAICAGEFREDLYYRLNVVTIQIPPLRERRDDIPFLFQHFAMLAAARTKGELRTLTREQIRALMAHPWPGNVRELRNSAERHVLLGENCGFDTDKILQVTPGAEALTLPQQVECFEKSIIEQELGRQRGSIKATIEALGVPRKTLYDKLRKYSLDRSDYQ
jgi:two-component system C4-dicarboxylate transport response regulator DctD